MSDKKLVVGNWKMNLGRESALGLGREIASGSRLAPVDVAVCPAFVHIAGVAEILTGSPIAWGAQNAYHQPNGAFTGEISMEMLVDLGCRFVILGHSERRLVIGESNRDVNAKLRATITAGLTPIVCVGETLEQREKGETKQVVAAQMAGSLAGLSAADCGRIVLAYEPVWAIGTGKNATPQQAQDVHADLRNWLSTHYNAQLAEIVRILYGGSVKPDNAEQLMIQPDINGALVGGASLSAASFLQIVNGAAAAIGRMA